jgi:hypothetical protein
MCYKIDNQEIGTYISGLIEREFKSARQFCIAYLQKNGFSEPGREDIQKMANRLSQIIKGAKAIQIHDLPTFSELLHVSFEQILSAGKCGKPKNRMTNYTVAQSHSKAEWTAYIEEKDNPIFNPDEYGKTVLEYAIMFGNYDFLKFFHLCGWNHDYAPNLADFIIKVNFMYCFIQNLMDTINKYVYLC